MRAEVALGRWLCKNALLHVFLQDARVCFMHGRTIVITGATSGIGKIAAEMLAKTGARIVLVARTKSRGNGTLAHLNNIAPGGAHSVYFADLVHLSEINRVAREIAHREPPIDYR
jgi:short-subunit dehydrogenase